MIKECDNCKEQKEHHAKGLCYSCYKKVKWSPKIASCKRCARKRTLHAKGFCGGCYNTLFNREKNRAYRARKANSIPLRVFRKTTKSCVLCGFDKIVDVFHIDRNKKNNDPKNLVGLCPNHHRMANNISFRHEINALLTEKGISRPLEDHCLT